MGQVLHGSAKTTHVIRAAIQRSQASIKELSERYGLNPKATFGVNRLTQPTTVNSYPITRPRGNDCMADESDQRRFAAILASTVSEECEICGSRMVQALARVYRCSSCGFLVSTFEPGAGTSVAGLDELRHEDFIALLTATTLSLRAAGWIQYNRIPYRWDLEKTHLGRLIRYPEAGFGPNPEKSMSPNYH